LSLRYHSGATSPSIHTTGQGLGEDASTID
jgi:hypothetical protein